MKILLIYNGILYKNPPYYVQKFACACQKAGHNFFVKTNCEILVENGEAEKIDCDVVLFFDKDLTLARALQKQGLRLVNSAEAIAICDDKELQVEKLCGKVPMPQTICAPKCFFANDGSLFLDKVAQKLGFPMIIKEKNGSWGQQVYLAKDKNELQNIYSQKSAKELIFQKFIKSSLGRDLRLFVAFGRVIGSICRQAQKGEFRANCELGGVATAYTPTAEQEALAIKCAEVLGLNFCGVDLLFGESGNLVCEVNATCGFLHIEQALGIDIAYELIKLL